jgi:hypothetical protein
MNGEKANALTYDDYRRHAATLKPETREKAWSMVFRFSHSD